MLTKYKAMLIKAKINDLIKVTAKPGSPVARSKKYRVPEHVVQIHLIRRDEEDICRYESSIHLSNYTLTAKSSVKKLKLYLYETFFPLCNNPTYEVTVYV